MFGMGNGEIAVIDRLNFAPVDFFHITAGGNPSRSQRREALGDVAAKIRIAPGTARIVHAHRLVQFEFAIHGFRRRERYLAKGNPDLFVQRA